ncbi:MAG: class I SAM-dependent methyltransferase [Bacteroidales bacterium]|nr:class I SAM-dependent methyltransferase [Bacteroidales bacterium]
MENETESNLSNNEIDISTYECLAEFREPLLDSIIQSLNVPLKSKGLDAGCGIGYITGLLAKAIGEKGHVTGLDVSKEFIQYARNNNHWSNLQFMEGDINSLQFKDNLFDWVWSIDTVWPGPKEFGCPAEEPLKIVKEFYRVIKPGGSVYLLFWSSQKLLPGYPVLEARLNTTSSATAPFIREMNPSHHIMNGIYWLQKSGFKDVSVKTHTGDIIAPFNENDRNALTIIIQMFWGGSQSEVNEDDWKEFINLTDENSDQSILNSQHYYGFYTYTLFQGKKLV